MENQDIDLIGQTVGNMPYKIGIVDQNGNLKNQFVANASTNRIDIPQSILGTGGGSTGGSTGGNTSGGTAGGNAPSQVPQLPSTVNLFSGSAVGDILLSGPSANYDNIQDGLLITLSNISSPYLNAQVTQERLDLSSIGLKTIKIPKEKLIVNSSFDISDQLPSDIGKKVYYQLYNEQNARWIAQSNDANSPFYYSIVSFGGATIKVLPNTTLSMNLTINVKGSDAEGNASRSIQIPVIRVNAYKN